MTKSRNNPSIKLFQSKCILLHQPTSRASTHLISSPCSFDNSWWCHFLCHGTHTRFADKLTATRKGRHQFWLVKQTAYSRYPALAPTNKTKMLSMVGYEFSLDESRARLIKEDQRSLSKWTRPMFTSPRRANILRHWLIKSIPLPNPRDIILSSNPDRLHPWALDRDNYS